MQGDAWGTRLVNYFFAKRLAIVDLLATEHVASLSHVDANLVRAASFELAFDHREVLERFDGLDMGDSPFAIDACNGAASPTVATVEVVSGCRAARSASVPARSK